MDEKMKMECKDFNWQKLSQNKLNNEKVKQNKERQKEQKEPKRAYCDRNFK